MAIVVATIGRPLSLARCLAALRDGTRAPEEVTIVDQSVGPEIEQVVRDCDTGWTRLRRIPAESLGVSRARNIGWRASAASIVAFTDDDCVPDRNWVSTIAESLAGDPELDALTGRVLGLGEETPDLRAVSQRTATSARTFAGRSLPWRVGTGGNFAVRHATIERAGGFDERLGPGTDARPPRIWTSSIACSAAGPGSATTRGRSSITSSNPRGVGNRSGCLRPRTWCRRRTHLRRGDPYEPRSSAPGSRAHSSPGWRHAATGPEGAAERAIDERLMLRGAWRASTTGLAGRAGARDRGGRS